MARQVRVPLDRTFTRFAIVDLDELGGATVGVNLRAPDGTVIDMAALRALLNGESATGAVVWNDLGDKPDNIIAAAELSGGGFVVRNGTTGAWSTQGFDAAAPAALNTTATAGASAAPARADHVHPMPALTDLSNVTAPSPADGDALTWDAGTSQWIPAAVSGGGGADPWTYVTLGGDFLTSSATATDVTGMDFTPDELARYEFEAVLLLRTDSATVGARPGIGWPIPTQVDGVAWVSTTSGADTTVLQNGNISGPVLAPVGGFPTTTGSWPALIRGVLITGETVSGNLRVRIASESGGTTVTVKAGSFIRYRQY